MMKVTIAVLLFCFQIVEIKTMQVGTQELFLNQCRKICLPVSYQGRFMYDYQVGEGKKCYDRCLCRFVCKLDQYW